jgi:hypothetical protein
MSNTKHEGCASDFKIDNSAGTLTDLGGDVTGFTATRSKAKFDASTIGSCDAKFIPGRREEALNVNFLTNNSAPPTLDIFDSMHETSVTRTVAYRLADTADMDWYTGEYQMETYVPGTVQINALTAGNATLYLSGALTKTSVEPT